MLLLLLLQLLLGVSRAPPLRHSGGASAAPDTARSNVVLRNRDALLALVCGLERQRADTRLLRCAACCAAASTRTPHRHVRIGFTAAASKREFHCAVPSTGCCRSSALDSVLRNRDASFLCAEGQVSAPDFCLDGLA